MFGGTPEDLRDADLEPSSRRAATRSPAELEADPASTARPDKARAPGSSARPSTGRIYVNNHPLERPAPFRGRLGHRDDDGPGSGKKSYHIVRAG
jgi:hypothetical protein